MEIPAFAGMTGRESITSGGTGGQVGRAGFAAARLAA